MLEFILTFGTSAPNYVYLFLIILQYLRTDSYTVRFNHMKRYRLKFWFEHGGICIWAANDKANAEYGYAINSNSLPISNELVSLFNSLEDEYYT